MADFSVPSAIQSLTESLKKDNPALYAILNSLTGRVNDINGVLNPAEASNRIITNPTIFPDDITNFTYILTSDNVLLNWSAADLAATYEIRKGTVWATASYVTTISGLQAILDPLIVGNTTFLIKAISTGGLYSVNAASVIVVVPVIPAPAVSGTSLLNTALLSWTAPISSFRIDHYNIYRAGVLLTTNNGTFFAYQEPSSGTILYGIAAVDIFGNVGSTQTVSVTVTAPTDYILQSIITSTFTGAKTNAFSDTSRGILEVCLNLVETYGNHFLTRGYASPQDQINAGFPYYGEPAQVAASYVETFNFGSIFTNIIVGTSWAFNLITAASVSIAVTLEFSTDNITFTAPVAGPTAFAASVKYVRVTVNFTGANNALLEFYNFQCSLSVHQETDSGNIIAVSTDAGGTVVTLNKAFKSINSITCIVKQTATRYPVVDYAYTTVNPTTFKVLVFDNAGVRQTETIGWLVKGIL